MIDDHTRERVSEAIGSLPVTATIQDAPNGLSLHMTLPLAHTRDEVWAAITEPAVLAGWSPIVPDRPLSAVGPAVSHENPEDEPVDASVLSVVAGEELRHRWGDGQVSWRVDAVEGGVTLVLEQEFDSREMAAMTAAGWHVCFAVLSLQLDGEAVGRVVGMDAMAVGWEGLRDRYAAV
ncbi:SRPBCC domain-containing protein [Gulosibacter molinativorax]|uniref:Activator of Hsp90 ATPase homologue 1/2-like C-terminal domain-containing protein n=1 Tax=Gulosibacter molinativorax TaxID=256821 RepID=A0ABT7C8U0_9MICO|nr:SRPBCC domain-containing protein [Gulosibacter molinativorax]MDJ1371636.1 hypothetical protein [Gulosibacter molinativorax]QUY61020.1 Hypothetical protein GMOLON4_296 [Gulosibacter molinativorax]